MTTSQVDPVVRGNPRVFVTLQTNKSKAQVQVNAYSTRHRIESRIILQVI